MTSALLLIRKIVKFVFPYGGGLMQVAVAKTDTYQQCV